MPLRENSPLVELRAEGLKKDNNAEGIFSTFSTKDSDMEAFFSDRFRLHLAIIFHNYFLRM